MPETIGDTLDALTRWLPALLPDDERVTRILDATLGAAPRHTPVDAAVLRRVEASAQRHSRHLELTFVDGGPLVPDTESHGWPPPDLRGIRRRAGGVRAVTRDADGVSTIVVDTLEPFDVAEPYLDAAVTLAERGTAVVVDLRANGGGDPATVAFLCGFVLGGQAEHLSDVHGHDGVHAWYTHELPGRHVPRDVPVAVLTSSATFSSAEALAYHLQARGRVAVVGERTPGGADQVTPLVLTPHVRALLPVGRVVDAMTGTNWEGHGVQPDIECPAADAPDAARAWIGRVLAARST